MASSKKRATITDIAREAGASTATVSRVLNNVDYPVKESLRRKIQEVARRLEYRPNIFSQMLKGGVNKVIGVIVPSITNPFYAQLVSDVERRCIARGYAPIICSSYNSARLEGEHLDMLVRQQVAGIVLSTINGGGYLGGKLASLPAPCVLFDQPLAGYKGSGVAFDFRGGGAMATRHLLDNGHRRIVFASQSIDRASRKLFFQGYRDALAEAGIAADAALVVTLPEPETPAPENSDYHYGTALAHRLMAIHPPPEAVVAANDIIAIGIMNALGALGVRIPDDMSIIGFDDIVFSGMVSPGLTTIRQSTEKTAELATSFLFERIDNPKAKAVRASLEPELVVRQSVAGARAGKWRRN